MGGGMMDKAGDRLAAAVDSFDEAVDKFADGLHERVVPQVKRLIERLNEIGKNVLR